MAETAETAHTSFYFLPKQPSNISPPREETEHNSSQQVRDDPPDGVFPWLASWFGRRRGYRSVGSHMRKVPCKIEPKVSMIALATTISNLPTNHPSLSLHFPKGLFCERKNVLSVDEYVCHIVFHFCSYHCVCRS